MRFEAIPLHPNRVVDDVDLSDLTASVQTGPAYWDPEATVATLVIPFDVEPTAAEAEAIRRRLVTVDAADEARLAQTERDAADPNTPSWARSLLRAELARYRGE